MFSGKESTPALGLNSLKILITTKAYTIMKDQNRTITLLFVAKVNFSWNSTAATMVSPGQVAEMFLSFLQRQHNSNQIHVFLRLAVVHLRVGLHFVRYLLAPSYFHCLDCER